MKLLCRWLRCVGTAVLLICCGCRSYRYTGRIVDRDRSSLDAVLGIDKKYWFYSHLSGNGEMGLGLRDRVSRLRGRSSRSIPRRCGSPLPSV